MHDAELHKNIFRPGVSSPFGAWRTYTFRDYVVCTKPIKGTRGSINAGKFASIPRFQYERWHTSYWDTRYLAKIQVRHSSIIPVHVFLSVFRPTHPTQ